MTIFSLFLIMCILVIGGVGVDTMRNEMMRTHLQHTLDRAVLAAADLDQQQEPEFVVQDYFAKSNMGNLLTSVTVEEGLTHRVVSATAETTTDTQLMHIIGIDELPVWAGGAATELIANVEISLALDISGSMRHSDRYVEMKEAADEFVDVVLTASGDSQTSINVIPYAGQTNPGPEMFDYLDSVRYGGSGGDYFPEWAQDISNIVIYFDVDPTATNDEERFFAAKIEGYPDNDVDGFNKDDLDEYYEDAVGYIVSLVPELEGKDTAIGASIKGGIQETEFFATNDENIEVERLANKGKVDLQAQFNDFYNSRFPNVSSCIEMDAGDFATSGLSMLGNDQVPHFQNWAIDWSVADWGWCPEDDQPIQYLSNDVTRLKNFIWDMRLHDGTGTHFAMKWALSLLDPTSQPAMNHLAGLGLVPYEFSNRPLAWSGDVVKYIVLMTDGNMSNQIRPTNPLDPANLTTLLSNQESSKSEVLEYEAASVQFFQQQCELAKENGVIVYTIAYLAPLDAQTEMKNCASSPAHFFEADKTSIHYALGAIASQINKLRLTQ